MATDNLSTNMDRNFIPVFSLQSIEKMALNPYREFLLYCADTILPNMEDKFNMSLRDLCNFYREHPDDTTIIQKMMDKVPGLTLVPGGTAPSSDRQETQYQFAIQVKGMVIGTCVLYRFTPVSEVVAASVDPDGVMSMEIRFPDFDGFDFVEVNRQDNMFTFSKDDRDTNITDMLVAIFHGMVNFLDFIRTYKAKTMIAKNIRMFAAKFIGPFVTDYYIEYLSDKFQIAVLCGPYTHKEICSYDGYLPKIKEFAKALEDKYGTQYASPTILGEEENKESES